MAGTGKDKELILYVDDEQKNLDSFKVIFRRDYDITVASSAMEGMKIMEEKDVKLVITDQRMPNMTGVEFLEKISDIYPDVTRVILTGYSDEEAIISAINKGKVFRYITKPWKKDELRQTIDYALEAYRLKSQNKELLERLKKANKELDEFVYRASHDLRAPIASILGLINLAKNESDPSKLREYLDMKEKSIHKLDHLLKDVIQFSRNSHLEVNTEDIDFEQLILSSFELHKYFEFAASVKKDYEIKGDEPFKSDKFRIEIILNNLISNAIRYSNLDANNPELYVGIEVGKDWATIKVKDNGVGIGPEQMDRIFDMFYRGIDDNTGSGLGLYIVKETIDKLSGRVYVNSELGKGSEFVVEIPNQNRLEDFVMAAS